MEIKLKIWIHCRVSSESERYLLKYQKEKNLKTLEDVQIIGISKELSNGDSPNTRALNIIKIQVSRGNINAVVVTDKTRLLVSENHYQEFKLLCAMHDVVIIDLQERESQLRDFLFRN